MNCFATLAKVVVLSHVPGQQQSQASSQSSVFLGVGMGRRRGGLVGFLKRWGKAGMLRPVSLVRKDVLARGRHTEGQKATCVVFLGRVDSEMAPCGLREADKEASRPTSLPQSPQSRHECAMLMSIKKQDFLLWFWTCLFDQGVRVGVRMHKTHGINSQGCICTCPSKTSSRPSQDEGIKCNLNSSPGHSFQTA